MAVRRSRVLVVDDSAITRRVIVAALTQDAEIEVVAEAGDAFSANTLIAQHRPDVVTLDLQMPRMGGLAFLRHLMQHQPVPVIIVSGYTREGSAETLEVLRCGAVDVLLKPQTPSAVAPFARRLRLRIRELQQCGFRIRPTVAGAAVLARAKRPAPLNRPIEAVIAIGASTGGPQAIEDVLSQLPADAPPVVVVQHMPATFIPPFAKRLDEACAMRVVEASDQEELSRGSAYLAPGDHHLLVERAFNGRLVAAVRRGPSVCHQRPSVDVLFESLSRLAGTPAVGVLLTGMGDDGARGMVKLVEAGHETIAESEQSCVVFGMPREAIARGGARHVLARSHIPAMIVACLTRLDGRAARVRESALGRP